MNTQKPLLLDGSMGQEIVNRGGKSKYGEWAVAALHENPDLVSDIHRDYISAGADVITTNTYSTTRTRLRHVELEDRFEELVQLAGKLAFDAREDSGKKGILIAASLGPLEASYINEFALSYEEMVAEFDELMRLLSPYVDIYLGETFSTIIEARAFLTAAQNHDKKVWVSYTLDDASNTHLRGQETLSDALGILNDFTPDAVLLNCCKPESIDERIDALKDTGHAFGGYANGFVAVPDEWEDDGDVVMQIKSREDLSPQVYGSHVQRWIEAGATVVGGCCDIGPAHIAHLRKLIDSAK
ncbi:MAG: homocysteine S-methyltransferase family protein [Chloroflexota bacterium]